VARVTPAEPLTVEGLACVRGGRLLFEGLGFRVEPGGALTVTGPNGAGKSSLLRLLAGLLPPAAGQINGGGARAYLGHEVALKPRQTLWTELLHWARLDRGSDAEVAVEQALAAFALAPLAESPCAHLSSGQRRRAALARVMASGAPLWLLDEPTAGLDTASAALLAKAMAAHRAWGGMVVAAVHGDIGLAAPAVLAL
jgi:heme exporter protein A